MYWLAVIDISDTGLNVNIGLFVTIGVNFNVVCINIVLDQVLDPSAEENVFISLLR